VRETLFGDPSSSNGGSSASDGGPAASASAAHGAPALPQTSPALPQTSPALPPAYPERAAWGTAPKLRAWQQQALEKYLELAPRDYLAVATPGAGKTTFALRVASTLIERGQINRVTIVAPTDHLKRQWADAAARVGIAIDPNFKNADGQHGRGFMGVAVTYAQVASKPLLHRAKTEAARTLVILDEIHHGGESLSWGDGLRECGAWH
jgi:superfamily II DNA or RNA helicase